MLEISEYDDLSQVWNAALEEYQKITAENLTSKPAATIPDIIAQISEKKVENHAEAKKYFSNALACIEKFGTAIASAAGKAFPGAEQCFNAVSLVIGAIGDYKSIFEGFTRLMEISSVFLGRLQGFLDNLENRASQDRLFLANVYDILRHFLLVLAQSYKLTKSKTRKTIAFVKVFCFSDDEGVAEAVKQMTEKIARLTPLEVDRIWLEVSDHTRSLEQLSHKLDQTNTTVRQIHSISQDREKKDKEHNHIRSIQEKLGLQINSWEEAHGHYRSQRTEGTGEWLTQMHNEFRKWSDVSASFSSRPTGRVIYLEGLAGFGKSHLCSNIVDHLIRCYPPGKNKAFVAYYFLEDTPSGKSTDRAVKALLLQLAQNRASFAEALAKLCGSSGGASLTATAIWKHMSKNFKKDFTTPVYFIVDGLSWDEGSEDTPRPLRHLIDEVLGPGASPLRLLISGTPDAMQSLQGDLRSSSTVIQLSPAIRNRNTSSLNPIDLDQNSYHSSLDMIKVINSTLDTMDVFSTSNEKDVRSLKADIRRKLTHGVRGNFAALKCKLDEIRECVSREEIVTVVERADEDISQYLSRELDAMERRLEQDDRKVLNETLVWVLRGRKYGCSLIQAALFMKFRKTVFLRQHITKRFSAILVVNSDDTVSPRYDELENVLRERAMSSSQAGDHDKLSSVESMEAEIRVAQRLLRTFCGEEIVNSLGLDEFLANRWQQRYDRIQLDGKTMHAELLRTCLEAIFEHHDEPEIETLRVYAFSYLHYHLKGVEPAQVSRETKKEVGLRLMRLLREPQFLSEWWAYERLDELGNEFTDENKSLRALREWLKDPAVQGAVQSSPSESRWLRSALTDESTVGRLLEGVLSSLGRHFLADMDYDQWTSEHFTRCHYKVYTKVNKLGKIPANGSPSTEHLEQMTIWSGELKETSQSVAYRQSQLGRIMCYYGDRMEGLSLCRQALKSGKETDWRLRYNLSLALGEGEIADKEEALVYIEDIRRMSSTSTDPELSRALWSEIYKFQAERNEELRRFDVAADIYELLISHKFGAKERWRVYSYVDDLINALVKQGDFSRLATLIQTLPNKTSIGLHLHDLLAGYPSWDVLHRNLLTAADDENSFTSIKAAYEKNVFDDGGGESRVSDERRQRRDKLFLKSWYALLLRYSPNSKSCEAAIRLWEENLDLDISDVVLDVRERGLLTLNMRELYKIYLNQIFHYWQRQDLVNVDLTCEKAVALSKKNPVITQLDVNDIRLGLVRLFQVVGRESQARKYARHFLADDYMAWRRREMRSQWYCVFLRRTLLALGDIENATAAADLFICGGRLIAPEKLEPDGHAAAENKYPADDDSEPIPTWGCDGRCGKATLKSERWTCMDCLDVDFEADCFAELQNGRLRPDICDPKHHFFHYSPIDEQGQQRISGGEIRVGGKWMSQRDWFSGLHERLDLNAATIIDLTGGLTQIVVRMQRAFRLRKARALKAEGTQQKEEGA